MNNQPLILVGCGRFGREVEAWIKVLGLPFVVKGFIDDEKSSPDVLGRITDHVPLADAQYLTCFGAGTARQNVSRTLAAKGARFASLIDPLLRTASPVDGLSNSILLGTIGISNNVSMGNNILIHAFASIGHDVRIGDGVTIGSQSFFGGGVVLGDHCTVHPGAVVLPDVTIGEGAIVGAGAVVIRNVPANTTVFGSPAKPISFGKPSD